MLAHDFVGLDRTSALQRFLADKASRIGRPLRLRVQLRGFEGVCRMVECGVGLGIVPETTARRAAKTMALAIVALDEPWAARDLTICVGALKDLPPYARELVAHLRELRSGRFDFRSRALAFTNPRTPAGLTLHTRWRRAK